MKIRELESKNKWDYENGYYWFSDPTRLRKVLAHYELYKSIIDLPGDIFELGVYKGASIVRLATFRSTLENDFSRKIVGFDAFGKFPVDKLSMKEDLDFIDVFEGEGGEGLRKSELAGILEEKNFKNITLIQGNVLDTLPEYIETNPATRISLLHLDMDVKEPTELALAELYDRVVPDGLIIFDDYNTVAGESDAVDSFVKNNKLILQKIPYYSSPAFIRKPG
jgi:hypothetical protein